VLDAAVIHTRIVRNDLNGECLAPRWVVADGMNPPASTGSGARFRFRTLLDPARGKRHNGVMNRVRISELRDHLSRYLDHVRAGGRILVLDRDRPVAEIVPVAPIRSDKGVDEARLAALEREGLISRGTGRVPAQLLRSTQAGKGAKVLQALLDERAAGR
jgi:prevent-host-death family protein